jgi:hypothetical protein
MCGQYNGVVSADPTRKAGDLKANIRRTETIGLLLLSVLVLIITLVRYWGDIRWSVW